MRELLLILSGIYCFYAAVMGVSVIAENLKEKGSKKLYHLVGIPIFIYIFCVNQRILEIFISNTVGYLLNGAIIGLIALVYYLIKIIWNRMQLKRYNKDKSPD